MKKMKVREGGWESKLQMLTFGKVPYKYNFCPFAWLTIFCLLVSPIVLPLQFLWWAAGLIVEPLVERVILPLWDKLGSLSASWQKGREEKKALTLTDEEAYLLFENSYSSPFFEYNHSTRGRTFPEIVPDFWKRKDETGIDLSFPLKYEGNASVCEIWKKNAGDDWADRLLLARKKWADGAADRKKALLEMIEDQKLKEARSKKIYAGIVQYTRWLLLLPVGVLLLYISKGLAHFWLWTVETYGGIIPALLVFGGHVKAFLLILWGGLTSLSFWIGLASVVGILGALGLLFFLSLVVWDNWEEEIKGFFWKLLSPFSFFVNGFSIFKENHCPEIEWIEK